MAVTVITKKRGRPLVTGEVGVSIINWEDKHRVRRGEIWTNWKCSGGEEKKKKKSGQRFGRSERALLERKRAHLKDNRKRKQLPPHRKTAALELHRERKWKHSNPKLLMFKLMFSYVPVISVWEVCTYFWSYCWCHRFFIFKLKWCWAPTSQHVQNLDWRKGSPGESGLSYFPKGQLINWQTWPAKYIINLDVFH